MPNTQNDETHTWSSRSKLIAQMSQQSWDLVVIGGGITGAGIAREAVRRGFSVALFERQDFAWGTSSRSSKMVHGGLRYLARGDVFTTLHSVRERERLMTEVPGLVDEMEYLMPHYQGRFPGPFLFGLLLRGYDFLAGKRYRQFYNKKTIQQRFPMMQTDGLAGATGFSDAVTDDSRLVMRVLHEARRQGACIINYMGVSDVAQDADGVTVTVQNYAPITKNGESAKDGEDAKASESVLDEPGETYQIRAKCVVNATGAWANQFDKADGKDAPNIRPARGSHIVIDSKKLPIDASFTVLHPRDNRPIFVYPWLGRTVIGTTDLDHPALGNAEVGMTQEELDYLLELTAWQFPDLQLKAQDVLASWAGVRPLVASGGLNSSGEKRDHSVWQNKRFISVSGGKLTTFRYIAKDVLEHAEDWLGEELSKSKRAQYFAKEEIEKDSTNTSSLSAASSHSSQRLKGHYGPELSSMLRNANQDTLGCVADTDILWQELVWSAGHEAVVHLDDLMLRRCRLGLLLTEGGLQFEDQLKTLLQPIFGWNDSQWQSEVERYRDIWHRYYWLPSHA